MKYRLTPCNGFSLFLTVAVLYFGFISKNPNENLAASYLLYFAIIILIGDLFLQLVISNYKKLILIEAVSLPIIIAITLLA
jgi:hypothetical protein